ncbi:MAG: hypothetical protein DRO62_01995 [Candidatus Altiarchaeales archaeon]|nr:MAG: hypothetical protein DRO62_01995 [Candidatus Altiarchaeales archaeon]
MDPYILLAVVIAILGTIIAVYFDFKESRIPNKLLLSMFIFSIPLALLRGDLSLWFVNLILALLIFYIFWELRVWAGGDSKLFIALSALIPVYPDLGVLSKPSYPDFFFLTILMNLLIVYLMHISILILVNSLREGTSQKFIYEFFTYSLSVLTVILIVDLLGAKDIVVITFVTLFVISLIWIPRFFTIPLIFLGILLYLNFKIPPIEFLSRYSLLPFIFSALYLYHEASKLKVTEIVKISDLRVGDNLAEKILLKDGEVVRMREEFPSPTSLAKEFFGKESAVVKPTPNGVTTEEKDRLMKLVKSGKISNEIEIYRGTRMSPMILVSLLLSIFVGDLVGVLI